jgi:hypothetical protein
MKEIRAGIHNGQEHVRGTSREHLLIDFSSSGSSGEEEGEDVSPAASDIGVLPLHGRGHPQPHFVPGYSYSVSGLPVQPVRVEARTVGRHVPLVDLGKQDTATQDENSLDDAWRWFGSDHSLASSSSISSSSSVTTTSYALKNTISSETSKIETLVDVDSEEAPIELVSVPQTIHVRHMAADGTHIKDSLHVIQAKAMALVDIDDNTSPREARLVDLGTDEVEKEHVPALVPLYKSPNPELTHTSTAFEAEAGYSHPLEIEAESVHVQVRPKSIILESPLPADPEASLLFGIEPQGLPRVAEPEPEHLEESQNPEESVTPQVLVDVDVDAGHPSVDSGVSTKPEQDSSPWSWDEVDVEDPWNQHLSMGGSTVANPESDLITFPGSAPSSTSDDAPDGTVVQDDDEAEELGVLEMSPGGSLLPTAIEDELELEGQDGVPVFDLENTEVEGEQLSQRLPTEEVELEEEITPKPTPVSGAVELPEVVVQDVEEEEFVYEPLVEKTVASPLEDDEIFVYPDPDLPPLPLHLEDAATVEQPLTTTTTLSVFAEALEAQMNTHLLAAGSASSQAENAAEKEHLIVPASQQLPSSQTPTPPASPPPTFGSHQQSHTHTHLRVLNPTTNTSRNGSRTPSPVSPTPRLAVVLPFIDQEARGEDKENDTPTAMTVGRFSESLLATKPLWSIRASDAPALGIPSSGSVLGASPRMRRSVLGDVDSNAEEVAEVEEEKEEPKERPEEVGLPSEAEVETKVDSESEADPPLAVVEQPTSDHQAAPLIKLSTSLPGSFPDVEPTPEVVESASPIAPAVIATTTVRRPVATPNGAAAIQFVIPSARTLVRSPLDIALAMQMRPGLGAGADPAWMVRFLMAVFGWMAVAVAGGDF